MNYNVVDIDFVAAGRRISNLRKQRGMTQEELAEGIDVSIPFVSLIENGKDTGSLLTYFRVANVLGCSLDDIFIDSIVNKEVLDQVEASYYTRRIAELPLKYRDTLRQIFDVLADKLMQLND